MARGRLCIKVRTFSEMISPLTFYLALFDTRMFDIQEYASQVQTYRAYRNTI